MNPDESVPSYELSIDGKISHMAEIGRDLGRIQRKLRNVGNMVGLDGCFRELVELIDGSWNSDLEMKLDDCRADFNNTDEFADKKKLLIDYIKEMRRYAGAFKNQTMFQRDEYRMTSCGRASLKLGDGTLYDGMLITENERIKLSPVSYQIAIKLAQNRRISYGEIIAIQGSRMERREIEPSYKSRMSKLKCELKCSLGLNPFENCRSEQCYKLNI